ncbi:hypothetical protein [Thalassobacillus sp. C254]|uniref:hypothetical protein n=1 Tax=Thalassobacillus sp. C254 TaxID=1225341 RepID=UPI0006D11C92|nr:hypothetical protein [Thalassobacillus sp. C254]
MTFDEIKQIILLTQDAKEIGWDFKSDGKFLSVQDENYVQGDKVFQSQNEILEWLENQHDKSR